MVRFKRALDRSSKREIGGPDRVHATIIPAGTRRRATRATGRSP